MSTFTRDHVEKLLYNKFIVIIGDSVQRTVYKDLLSLLTSGELLLNHHLKSKGQPSIFGDKLIERSDLTNGKWYREVREYHTPYYLIRFYFVTQCYSDYMETILMDLSRDPAVDVLVMNSCLWDVSRYGHRGMSIYKDHLQILFSRFKTMLPAQCLKIWHTAMPVGRKIQTRGFLLPDIAFLENILSQQVREGNCYACQVASEHGIDIIDLHWFFKQHVDKLVHDGIHWNAEAHRRMTDILLTHLCLSWDIDIPPLSLSLHSKISSTSSSRSSSRDAGRKRKRGHVRCSSLPDLSVCGSRVGSGNRYQDQNNNYNWTGIDNNNNSRSRSNRDDDTLVRMSRGVKAYNSMYGPSTGSSSHSNHHRQQKQKKKKYWKQGALTGAMMRPTGERLNQELR